MERSPPKIEAASKDGSRLLVKAKLGSARNRICEHEYTSVTSWKPYHLRRLSRRGPASCPRPSCCAKSVTRTSCVNTEGTATRLVRRMLGWLRNKSQNGVSCGLCKSRLHQVKATGGPPPETVSANEGVVSPNRQTQQLLESTYTKLSLTETTKTLPASLSLAELIYPGIWFSEQAGE